LFSKDHRGSIAMVVDSATGEIKQKIKYSDWGEVLEDTNPGLIPFGYAGGIYDPQIGRWLAKDPIRFDGGDTNLYGYVGQDPANQVDYSGRSGILVGIGRPFPVLTPEPLKQSPSPGKKADLPQKLTYINQNINRLTNQASGLCKDSNEYRENIKEQ